MPAAWLRIKKDYYLLSISINNRLNADYAHRKILFTVNSMAKHIVSESIIQKYIIFISIISYSRAVQLLSGEGPHQHGLNGSPYLVADCTCMSAPPPVQQPCVDPPLPLPSQHTPVWVPHPHHTLWGPGLSLRSHNGEGKPGDSGCHRGSGSQAVAWGPQLNP